VVHLPKVFVLLNQHIYRRYYGFSSRGDGVKGSMGRGLLELFVGYMGLKKVELGMEVRGKCRFLNELHRVMVRASLEVAVKDPLMAMVVVPLMVEVLLRL